MGNDEKVKKMIDVFKMKTVDSAIKGFTIEQNDEITNKVRAYLDSLPKEELVNIQLFLKTLLNYCYEGRLLEEELNEDDKKRITELEDKEKFLLKESIIYFYGRLLIDSDMDILRDVYNIDDNKYIKLNVTFASLQSFKEEIELDFVDKVLSSDVYDQLIRSWTLAYFQLTPNPYDYVDKDTDDWSAAKKPRIERLRINDENNPKFKKAKAFRLLDLVVLYLFIRNRKVNNLTDEEKQVIRDARIDYEEYSDEKKKKIQEVKNLILTYKK